MFRHSRQQPLIATLPPPGAQERRPRRGQSPALGLSLLVNVALLLLMAYHGFVGGRGGIEQQPAVAKPAVATQAVAAGGATGDAAAAAGAGSQGSTAAAEELLEGIHTDAAGLLLRLREHEQQAGTAAASGTAAAAAASGPSASARYWLTIGIPTVPRSKSNTTYLTATLESLMDELPSDLLDPWYGRVRVLVMNNGPGGRHPEFQALRERAKAGAPGDRFAPKAASYIDFLDNPGTVTDPAPELPDPDDLNNPEDRPGRHVRKQTCDLVTLMRHAAPLSSYYLFMEDDFEVCPYALRALHYVLLKANSLPHLRDWLAVRVSYGMNGVLMRNADLLPLADFLWEYITKKPPDLLWVEYLLRQPLRDPAQQEAQRAQRTDRDSRPLPLAGRRPFVVYKYNLFAHLGAVSSFEVRPDRAAWPGCFESMSKVWSLQTHERFVVRCRHTDLSPCVFQSGSVEQPQGAEASERWVGLPLDWSQAMPSRAKEKTEGGSRASRGLLAPLNRTARAAAPKAALRPKR